MEQQTKGEYQRYHLSTDVIRGLLTRDMLDRKSRSWKLLTPDEMEQMWIETSPLRSEKIYVECDCFINNQNSFEHPVRKSWNEQQMDMVDWIEESFPFIQDLLRHQDFNGKICAAGGAVARSINSKYMRDNADIDLFFINDVSGLEQITYQTTLLTKALSYISHRFLTAPNTKYKYLDHDMNSSDRKIYITRNQHVVTLYCVVGDNEMTFKYQFILRVYPSIGAVLGGFDISASMCAYDGYNIVATELGAWSMCSGYSIIDTTRRSTTFEKRINKYSRFTSFIYPGLPSQEKVINIVEQERIPREEIYKQAKKILNENGCIWRHGDIMRRETKQEIIDHFESYATERGYNIINVDLELIDEDDNIQHDQNDNIEEYVGQKLKRLFEYNGYMPSDDTEKLWLVPVFQYRERRLRLPYITLKIMASMSMPNKHLHEPVYIPPSVKQADSDYGDVMNVYLELTGLTNVNMLINNKISSVMSIHILTIPGSEFVLSQAFHAINDSIRVLKDTNTESIEKTVEKCLLETNIGDMILAYNYLIQNSDHAVTNINLQKRFGEFTKEVSDLVYKHNAKGFNIIDTIRKIFHQIDVCKNQEFACVWDFVRKMRQRIETNRSIAIENLSTIKWITENPGRQWTSSINPIIKHPSDWYGKYYKSFRLGNQIIETTLRLMRKRKGNLVSSLNRDIFNLILQRFLYIECSLSM